MEGVGGVAEKRMFTQKIIDSDAFLDMPLSTQALYFHLNMRADDDGFVNNPKRIQRTVGASEDDLKLLIAKRFLICFENGVIVIKHWRMHNTLKSDRYRPTQYQEEYALLEVLVKNRNIALSRQKLMKEAWDISFMGESRTVDVHVQRLRKKLGLGDHIATLYRFGYRFEEQP